MLKDQIGHGSFRVVCVCLRRQDFMSLVSSDTHTHTHTHIHKHHTHACTHTHTHTRLTVSLASQLMLSNTGRFIGAVEKLLKQKAAVIFTNDEAQAHI